VISRRSLANVIMLMCLTIGTWHLGSASWIYSKAYAASFLINEAWQATLTNNAINKPWSWADTWPVAKLSIPAIELDEIILSGDSGSSLAFGPGLSQAGAALHEDGTKLISGHRDTHFSQLQYIAVDDDIFIKTASVDKKYKVIDIKIVDSRTESIDPAEADYDLVLATCYPFNSVSVGGPQRFIVRAIEQQVKY